MAETVPDNSPTKIVHHDHHSVRQRLHAPTLADRLIQSTRRSGGAGGQRCGGRSGPWARGAGVASGRGTGGCATVTIFYFMYTPNPDVELNLFVIKIQMQ